MPAFTRRLVLIYTLGCLALCSPAYSQWRGSTEVGAERFWGGSLETTGEHRSFRPYRPTTMGIGLEHQGERLSLGLQIRYAEAALALEGSDAVVAVDGVFDIIGFAPELVYRLVRVGAVNQLRLHAGPLIEIWTVVDEEARVRAGAQATLSFDVPLGSRFGASILAGAALGASPFNEDELEPSYELRALWRRRFAVALGYRL
ncbi:MAG TPA: hypothetical protein VFX42_05660 [Gemmatimonadales bacterium]|nr:hypothetical protein [Gemmatimonadales bacterium]